MLVFGVVTSRELAGSHVAVFSGFYLELQVLEHAGRTAG
jgi:hypothetical protein